jgi:hypothetical protein
LHASEHQSKNNTFNVNLINIKKVQEQKQKLTNEKALALANVQHLADERKTFMDSQMKMQVTQKTSQAKIEECANEINK